MSSSSRSRRLFAGVALLMAVSCTAIAETYIVSNTNDDGPGSLRQALADANAHPNSTVVFQIGTGHQKIRPLTGFGIVAGTIDGTTQPGYAGTPLIEIDGSLLGGGSCIGAYWGVIRALAINRCSWSAVELGDGGAIRASFVGTDVTGTIALGNGRGIQVSGGATTIGGSAPGDGNLISGNVYGIYVQNQSTIQGNRIGTDAAGMASLPNVNAGIFVWADNVTIGGPLPEAGNLISGNTQYGIEVYASGTTIQNNVIGPDAAGGGSLAQQRAGVMVDAGNLALIGGPGAGNTIAHSWEVGIGIQGAAVRDRISANRIYANAFGIDLNYLSSASDRRTSNDPEDVDSGTNLLQNFPELQASTASGGLVTVQGSLNSEPDATYDVELFANSPGGSGQTFLGSTALTADSAGNGAFSVTFVADVAEGDAIIATATDAYGDTSEFSDPVLTSASTVQLESLSPTSGPATGGTGTVLIGSGFQSDAAVSFGSAPSGTVTVVDATQITTSVPALVAGEVYPVIIANGDLSTGGRADGWFADFLDVPGSHPFHSWIETLVRKKITAGCGAGDFCPEALVTRAQAAVLLLKAAFGASYMPPGATGTIFADVPLGSFADRWIEDLSRRGISTGCGGGNYCPSTPVRRDQMAVLLLKAEHGSSYTPPACAPPGIYADVPCPGAFSDWIEQLAAENVTGGCGSGNYCPGASNLRGQMATFLVKTFGLQ